MQKISVITSRTVVLPQADVDTDQIVPARFLTTTSREGMGDALFADWRYDNQGRLKSDFVLNRPEAKGCSILVAGNNFGCGSSREHAPWALVDYGFRAVISSEIADIFRSNALKNGLLPVVVDEATHRWLIDNPGALIDIDLASNALTLPDGRRVGFQIEAFARYCLLQGVDEMGYLRSKLPDVDRHELARGW